MAKTDDLSDKTALKELDDAAKRATAPAKGAAKAETAKSADKAALPDAALLDDDADGAADGAPPAGWRAWLPTGRRRWIVLAASFVGLMIVVAATVAGAAYFRHPAPENTGPEVVTGPAQAVDGATLAVAGRTVRLSDIDAPPASLMCRDGAWQYRCGDEARRGLDRAIGKGPVECVDLRPGSAGQVEATCRNDAGLDIGAIQVESGWAVDDMKKSSRYVAEESRARDGNRGLWRNDFAHPELWNMPPVAER